MKSCRFLFSIGFTQPQEGLFLFYLHAEVKTKPSTMPPIRQAIP